jgi:hypothetical protein
MGILRHPGRTIVLFPSQRGRTRTGALGAEAEVDPQKIDDGLLHTAVQRVMLTFPKQAASA